MTLAQLEGQCGSWGSPLMADGGGVLLGDTRAGLGLWVLVRE